MQIHGNVEAYFVKVASSKEGGNFHVMVCETQSEAFAVPDRVGDVYRATFFGNVDSFGLVIDWNYGWPPPGAEQVS